MKYQHNIKKKNITDCTAQQWHRDLFHGIACTTNLIAKLKTR